ncbi:YbjQ family protein [Methanothermobacter sp. K4]|uniref:YbjQ family protein n=1 Tax=Methanothermobacter sp. K4 TaxID=2913262 RepID=UPI001ED9F97C|nr:YbjQ family protein [Methanothermobacter sp. K4]MCG2828502.1 YbjQ family protein [Methanothermobacter sp. K4]
MLMLTSNVIEGRVIGRYHGIVTGDALIGANIYKDLFSGVRDVVGGRTSAYEKELARARELALSSMREAAEKLGADAIIGVRIDYHNLGGTMGNTILVSATGTAVSLDE